MLLACLGADIGCRSSKWNKTEGRIHWCWFTQPHWKHLSREHVNVNLPFSKILKEIEHLSICWSRRGFREEQVNKQLKQEEW